MVERWGARRLALQRSAVRLVALALLSAVSSTSGLAEAQSVPSLDVRRFEPPGDPRGAIFLEPTLTPGAGEWNVGVWPSYAHRSVVLEDEDGATLAVPLEHQLSVDYLAAVSLTDRLAVSATLPTIVWQNGDDASRWVQGAEPLPRTALGDAALGAKATLVPTRELGGFGLAALARVSAPTGDAASYAGEGAVTGTLRLLAELKLAGGSLRATAGARVRSDEDSYAGEEYGHDLPWGIGLALRPRMLNIDAKDRWEWNVEAHGAIAMTPSFASGPQSPALVGLSARYTVKDVSALLGVELPASSGVGAPLVRTVLGLGWAPRVRDMDNDGVLDERDHCPELAEDRDGFEDADGCPDFDNDGDGVSDAEDRCPGGLEDTDEYEDEDGCMDPDNDGDGVFDAADRCPNKPGPDELGGCPLTDRDRDGVRDEQDKCPDESEDRDGFADDDGCPELDNDADGLVDSEDACPTSPGIARSDPGLSGCPSPDRDGDTFDDALDPCPDQPEDFDGDDDEGCPDDRVQGQPLVRVDRRADDLILRWRVAPRLLDRDGVPVVDPRSEGVVRALAQLLNQNPSWVMMVGVRPVAATNEAHTEALARSFALVHELRSLTHRDQSAESVAWSAVQGNPGAQAAGVGVLVVAAGELAGADGGGTP